MGIHDRVTRMIIAPVLFWGLTFAAASGPTSGVEPTAVQAPSSSYSVHFAFGAEGLEVDLRRAGGFIAGHKTVLNPDDLALLVDTFIKPLRLDGIGAAEQMARLKSFNAALGKSLYAMLFGGILDGIPQGSLLEIHTLDSLDRLPFEMLVLRGEPKWEGAGVPQLKGLEFLGDRYVMSYRRAADFRPRRFPAGNRGDRILFIGDPEFEEDRKARPSGAGGTDSSRNPSGKMDSEGSNVIWPRLVLTGELGGRVLNLFPGKADIFLRDKARKAVLLQNLGAYRAVMIATQGMPEDEAPDRAPYLVLGGEERLYAHEIEKLGIPAECVFLASCGGAIPPRQGRRMSIAEAFLAAGAGAVVGSLWAVAEDAACEMAYEFTVQLKAGLNPEQALHQARMAIRARGFDHPFFWAPFIVIRPSP